MNKCPICKSPLNIKDYSDSLTVEFYEKCEECGLYGYEEWCGNFKTYIGNTQLISSYNSSNKLMLKNDFILKKKITKLRNQYRKSKKFKKRY